MEHDLTALIDRKIPLDVAQTKCIIKQILEGVYFLHCNNVMHRDIKGANILMNQKGEVKLADFGLARMTIDRYRLYTNPVVTLWYRAPELLLGSNSYNSGIDVWSVGCCFAELLNYSPLFKAGKEAQLLEQIYQKCGSPTEETWPGVTKYRFWKELGPKKHYPNVLRKFLKQNAKIDDLALDLLEKMLTLDPNKRITAKEALEHVYFKTQPLPCLSEQLPTIKGEAHEYEVKHIFVGGKMPGIVPNPYPINVQTQGSQTNKSMLDLAKKRELSPHAIQATVHLEPKDRIKQG